MAAKLTTYHEHVIRIDKASGIFYVDGIDGKHESLAAAKAAIDDTAKHAVDVPALYHSNGWADGDPGELEEVRFLGIDPRTRRIRIKRGGRIDLVYDEAPIWPADDATRATWARYRAMKIEAARMERSADALLENIPKITGPRRPRR
jgi:hypothetical protein